MRLKDGLGALYGPGKGSAWNLFPWVVTAFMTVVVLVNGAMVWFALGTFPGQAGSDGFDMSNHYDQVLDAMQRQAALGWHVAVSAGRSGRPEVVLTDRSGAPLRDAQVDGVATRPLGPPDATTLAFRSDGAGRYVAHPALDKAGQWDVQITVHALSHTVATTKRLIIPLPLAGEVGAKRRERVPPAVLPPGVPHGLPPPRT